MAEHIIDSIFRFLPEIALTITLVLAVAADVILKEKNRHVAWVVLAGLAVTGFFVIQQAGWKLSIFSDMLAVDPFALFFKALLLIAGIFIVFFSLQSRELETHQDRIGEYYMLITGVILGMFLMVGATHLLLIYLAFELTSISSYVLAGFTRRFRKSAEASMKYFVFGAVSSGFLLYGISLLAGVTGAMDIYGVRDALQAGVEQQAALHIAVIMIIIGFSYKITVIPFHFWAPDVYEGAPVTITTFLATASKIAGFALMIRFFRISFMDAGHTASGAYATGSDAIRDAGTLVAGNPEALFSMMPWNVLLAVLAAITMLSANLMALWQENIKRLLAYSSIAHAGFILIGLALLTDEGISAMLIYLAIYLFMNMGAFYVVMLISNKLGTEKISDYEGLGRRSPFLAISMAIFLIALAGFPPTAGFIAKVYIFGSAINAGWLGLAAIAGLASVIALFYYIRVVRNMFLVEPKTPGDDIPLESGAVVILLLLLLPVLLLGVYFTPIITWAKEAIQFFGL